MPTILFNNASGSDSAASGAGPATAVTGSAAAHTNGSASTTITLTNTPDLSGVATDGSAVLWLKTATTTRRFSKITGADNTAKTVTVEDSFSIASGSAVDYAIGGKRKTIEHADSVRLFVADAKPSWIITLEDDQPALTAEIACTAAGSTSGDIVLQGDSATTKRLLTSATDNTSLLSGGLAYWHLKNLKFTSSAGTKTSSYGLNMNATTPNAARTIIENCEFGDATNTLQKGIHRNTSSQNAFVLIDSEFHHCIGDGLDNGGGGAGVLEMYGCDVHHNGGRGVFMQFGGAKPTRIESSTITNNGGIGVEFNSSVSNLAIPDLRGNVIAGNGSDGVKVNSATNFAHAVIINNNITGNGGYGVNYAGSTGDGLKSLIDFNNYGTGGSANTSGAVNGFTAGAHDITVDPGYPGSGDYSSGANLHAKGLPDSTRKLGGNPATGTTAYRDIGLQHQDAGGSTAGARLVGPSSLITPGVC